MLLSAKTYPQYKEEHFCRDPSSISLPYYRVQMEKNPTVVLKHASRLVRNFRDLIYIIEIFLVWPPA